MKKTINKELLTNYVELNHKKATSEMWWILATAFIVLVVVVIILVFFKGGAEKLFGGIGTQISGLEDCDGDKVADFADKCLCVQGEVNGCPKTVNENDKRGVGDRSCCVEKSTSEPKA